MLRANVFGGKKARKGYGFSLAELADSEVEFGTTKRLRVAVDKRRKTKHGKNMEVLKLVAKESEGKEFKKSKTKKSKGPVAQSG